MTYEIQFNIFVFIFLPQLDWGYNSQDNWLRFFGGLIGKRIDKRLRFFGGLICFVHKSIMVLLNCSLIDFYNNLIDFSNHSFKIHDLIISMPTLSQPYKFRHMRYDTFTILIESFTSPLYSITRKCPTSLAKLTCSRNWHHWKMNGV